MMTKFITNIFIFFIGVYITDYCFGQLCHYMNSHAKGGETKNQYYIANECNKDIILLGSSRCLHHYVPSIIEDSLGMSCYNCGSDAACIINLYARLLMITNHHQPKIVIYDIYNDVAKEDNTKFIGNLKRFCDINGVINVIERINPMEKYKLKSNLYRYNGDFIQMAADNISPSMHYGYGGFKPYKGILDYEPVLSEETQLKDWDPVKKQCMYDMISLCNAKAIKLILVYSPYYGGIRPACDSLMHQMAAEYNIPIISQYSNPEICMDCRNFNDPIHLNDVGAEIFTKLIVKDIAKQILKQ